MPSHRQTADGRQQGFAREQQDASAVSCRICIRSAFGSRARSASCGCGLAPGPADHRQARHRAGRCRICAPRARTSNLGRRRRSDCDAREDSTDVLGRHGPLLHDDEEPSAPSREDGSHEIRPRRAQARRRTKKRRSSNARTAVNRGARRSAKEKPASRRVFCFSESASATRQASAGSRIARNDLRYATNSCEALDAALLGARAPLAKVREQALVARVRAFPELLELAAELRARS